jgi:hypothetical protein
MPPNAATWTNPSKSYAKSPTAVTTSWPRPPAIEAGAWYASPATHVGYELIGAGMLILAGDGRGLPFDYDELERWTRVGYERGMRSARGNVDGLRLSACSKGKRDPRQLLGGLLPLWPGVAIRGWLCVVPAQSQAQR